MSPNAMLQLLMPRRSFARMLAAAALGPFSPGLVRLASAVQRKTLRGALVVPARLRLGGGAEVRLEGDKSTEAVLADDRLNGSDIELTGEATAPGRLKVDPIHTRAMRVHKEGRVLQISYWCEVCSIRTYAPGKCMCCQEETALDLKEKFDP
jgi:hypothetical protein